jgi:DNA topoisomerase-1
MYVTDGETNATLRRGDTVEAMTIERAQELLAIRRAQLLENPHLKSLRTRRKGAKRTSKKY